ncbi:hypothetical protein AJ78_06645 [Emergomyces pasteurianus Ep9510]|uniref:Uncharacterized protein n=1 Tax=Emergomyces pasteurianus Ep9510 TaxID=1447872 RepID=A0A1J9P9S6_9EURO|nr:hypothetical protein AJ78_06645 [Emergomyces pasteurianus Ep9510]
MVGKLKYITKGNVLRRWLGNGRQLHDKKLSKFVRKARQSVATLRLAELCHVRASREFVEQELDARLGREEYGNNSVDTRHSRSGFVGVRLSF